MNLEALRSFIQHVPKTETHLHVEGALPWELLEELNPVCFKKVPDFRKADFRYESFEQFETILIEHAMHWFNSPERYFEAARLIFDKHLKQNTKYVEISFHAGMIEFLKIPGEEILNAILFAAPKEIEVRVFLGISRNAYTSFLGPKLEEAIKWERLSGIDLHGLESLPLESWTVPFWDKARLAGKTVKVHAGEFGPASNVYHAITELKSERIQHGTRAIEDEAVQELLLDRDITLDMCPISNYKLRVINNWTDHPIKEFLKKGIRCTVSTDDPLSFNNTLVDEYMALFEKVGLSLNDLCKLIINGFMVADIPNEEKNNFQNQVRQHFLKFDDLNG